ncbi:MAG: DegT/DnrJ/EryC1/StrS family aminotransferase [Candidatus Eutrophobiaceae bacterium]
MRLRSVPRGVICHTIGDSIRYLFQSLFSSLSDESRIAEFEKAFASYCGRKHCVAFPFARTAIHAALQSLSLPRGSKIILPPITIKGIVDAVVDLGLIPVYVDLDLETACFRQDSLRAALDSSVKAAIITPLFGLVPDLNARECRRMPSWHGSP